MRGACAASGRSCSPTSRRARVSTPSCCSSRTAGCSASETGPATRSMRARHELVLVLVEIERPRDVRAVRGLEHLVQRPLHRLAARERALDDVDRLVEAFHPAEQELLAFVADLHRLPPFDTVPIGRDRGRRPYGGSNLAGPPPSSSSACQARLEPTAPAPDERTPVAAALRGFRQRARLGGALSSLPPRPSPSK